MSNILISVISLGSVACGAAVILFLAAKRFAVHEDPRIDTVQELLPGANCGGCGYPGCRNFAEALVSAADKKDMTGLSCPPGGNDVMTEVGKALGVEVADVAPTVAVVRCNGSCENAPAKASFDGPSKCRIAHAAFAGDNGCQYGCLGLGDCEFSCDYDAIVINKDTGLPEVDEEKCTSCGACVRACPRSIIEIRPIGRKGRRVWISCINKEKGALAKKNCSVACIGCGKCAKVCPEKVQAITIENNIAYIDFDKCIACRKCIPECPTKSILASWEPPPKKEKPAEEAST